MADLTAGVLTILCYFPVYPAKKQNAFLFTKRVIVVDTSAVMYLYTYLEYKECMKLSSPLPRLDASCEQWLRKYLVF
eukprot:scaffold10059_cov123-Isochrysis_galbana.AAC.10